MRHQVDVQTTLRMFLLQRMVYDEHEETKGRINEEKINEMRRRKTIKNVGMR